MEMIIITISNMKLELTVNTLTSLSSAVTPLTLWQTDGHPLFVIADTVHKMQFDEHVAGMIKG